MIDIDQEFHQLLKELEADADRIPKNLARLIHTHGVIVGIKFGTETIANLNDTAELLDVAKKILQRGE